MDMVAPVMSWVGTGLGGTGRSGLPRPPRATLAGWPGAWRPEAQPGSPQRPLGLVGATREGQGLSPPEVKFTSSRTSREPCTGYRWGDGGPDVAFCEGEATSHRRGLNPNPTVLGVQTGDDTKCNELGCPGPGLPAPLPPG